MPSSQKLALNCNSRQRYKGSKFDSIPYKSFKLCFSSFSLELTQNQRDLYGAVPKFHPLYFGWELQLRGNFWQGPIFKDALFENGAKSHNFSNSFFCDVTLQDSIVYIVQQKATGVNMCVNAHRVSKIRCPLGFFWSFCIPPLSTVHFYSRSTNDKHVL